MNLMNQPMYVAGVDALELEARHRVLEVGFGGGSLLDRLLQHTPKGKVAGVELSRTMLERALRRFRADVARGVLQLQRGTVEALPFGDARFDRVITVNTIYFWPDAGRSARELRRVLVPTGRLVLGYRARGTMSTIPFTRHGFTLYAYDEVEALLRDAGFAAVESTTSGTGNRAFVTTRATATWREPGT